VSPGARRGWVPWLVSFAITAGIFWYLLSQIELAELVETARAVAPGPLVAFGLVLLAGTLARTVRFWILLGRGAALRTIFAITLVRNLFVDLLPARMGELTFVYFVARHTRLPAEDGLAALVLAFLFDLVALAPLLILGLLVVGVGDVPVSALVAFSVVLGAGAFIALWLAGPIASAVAGWLEPRTTGWMQSLAARLRTGSAALSQARDKGIFGRLLLLSFVVRLCKIGSYYCLVVAIMLPLGYAVEEIGVFRVLLGVVAAELAAALPIHGIAGFGTYEAAWALSFVQLGFAREHAIISGILTHAISQLVEYTMGTAALIWLMRPARAGGAGVASS